MADHEEEHQDPVSTIVSPVHRDSGISRLAMPVYFQPAEGP